MSSPNHPTFDIEDAFSSTHSPDYTPASPDYVLALPGKNISDSSNDSSGLVPIASPTLLLFHDDPYMKVIHAYDASIPAQVPIPLPIIMPPSPMLSPIFNPQEFFVPEELLPPKEQVKERLVNGWMIIQRDFDELKIELEKVRSQISRLQKKHIGQKDKIAFVRFRISTLEITLKDIQARHQLYMESLYGYNPLAQELQGRTTTTRLLD
uniref:Reverse transcriptase domain-containing protein n=1 Tax=Tanacetum cinerariifolium TaxID=118510 RepID=A0A6L2P6H6_TANCI|nr:hypothetical protein [Tanacetum cinerariifolium]